jgi:cytochrome c553
MIDVLAHRSETSRYSSGVGALALGLLLSASACTEVGKNAGQETVDGTIQVCSSCHGFDGRSVSPTFPRLAGQQQEYLTVQLKAFRDHTRADPHAHTYMWGMAAQLTDPTIDGLATYYAGQTPAPGTPGDPADMAAGQKIFEEGVPAGDVPPCKVCHGDKAEGANNVPRLASQHRAYLEGQLSAFAANSRANEIMHANAVHLTEEQIRQIATYVAAQ